MTEPNRGVGSKASPAQLPPEASPEQKQSAYEAYVAGMACKADGTLFLNHDQAHAEIVLAQLFKSAEHEVKILTGCLKDEVYGSDRIGSAAMEFATKPEGRLSVLHEYTLSDTNRFIDKIAPIMGDRFSIAEVGPCKITHFAVADGKHYRVETDKDHHKAFVAFGETNLGEDLSNIFDSIADSANK